MNVLSIISHFGNAANGLEGRARGFMLLLLGQNTWPNGPLLGASWAFLFTILVSWTLEIEKLVCSSVLGINIGICICRILVMVLTISCYLNPLLAFDFEVAVHLVFKYLLLGLSRGIKTLKGKKSSALPSSLPSHRQQFYLPFPSSRETWFICPLTCFLEERHKRAEMLTHRMTLELITVLRPSIRAET